MIRIFAFFLLVSLPIPLLAQWEDNIWLFGYRYSNMPSNQSNGFFMDFSKGDTLRTKYQNTKISFDNSYASVCDTNGQLYCLSNGCFVTNGSFDKIPNSDGLNPGIMEEQFCIGIEGYNISNSIFALKDPAYDHRIHFFHYPLVLENNWFYYKNLLHTVVELTANNGSGAVITKNDPIIQDSISLHGLCAVRHGNGRDWWVVAKKLFGNKLLITYLGADTLTTHVQSLGDPHVREAFGELVFSPGGNKLAMYDPKQDLFLYDFDRCSGTFSNPVHIPIIDPDSIQNYGGAAWSADGRFLYCSTVKRIYQFDMQAADIAASMVLVATRNAGGCPNSPTASPVDLSYMELMPDGRILSTGLSAYQCMHIMQHPERVGESCQVEQGVLALDIPITNLPHFPNFRLGPLDGSPCDTLGLNNQPLANWRYDRSGGNGVDFTSVSWYEPTAWLWDFGDGSATSSERNPSHTFPGPGAYEVCLTVSNQYGSDTKCKTVWVLASSAGEPVANGDGFRLYPNPTTGVVHWDGAGDVSTIIVTDLLGKCRVEIQEIDGTQIDLGNLIPGTYILRMFDRQGKVLHNAMISKN